MHLSFARCFFFYLSFLFPPVEPGVFNCCETTKSRREFISPAFYIRKKQRTAAAFTVTVQLLRDMRTEVFKISDIVQARLKSNFIARVSKSFCITPSAILRISSEST